MSLHAKGMVLGVLGIGGMVAMDQANLRNNYEKIDGVIKTAVVDCFVKEGKSKIVTKKDDRLAYMDCELAPVAAEAHGFSKSAIKQRVSFVYNYKSPVDGKTYEGRETEEKIDAKKFKVGSMVKIYAHKEEAAKSRYD